MYWLTNQPTDQLLDGQIEDYGERYARFYFLLHNSSAAVMPFGIPQYVQCLYVSFLFADSVRHVQLITHKNGTRNASQNPATKRSATKGLLIKTLTQLFMSKVIINIACFLSPSSTQTDVGESPIIYSMYNGC